MSDDATFVCPTCGSEVDVADMQPEIRPVKNGFFARNTIRKLVGAGSSPELAVANLRGIVSSYERALARSRHRSAMTGKAK